MSVFHSTVSRRDFMKTMGMLGAGIGAAALTAPVFHDVDELISSSGSLQKRPWYVKERDLYNPTVEVDWALTPNRYDPRFMGQAPYTQAYYYGKDRVLASADKGAAVLAAHQAAKDPGYTMQSSALAVTKVDPTRSWVGCTAVSATNATGITLTQTPAQRGVPKWSGTPEEARRMMTAAMRFYGGALFGFGELDQRMRDKVVTSCIRGNTGIQYIDQSTWTDTVNKLVTFEDVDLGYETTTKRVIPNKPMWWVCMDFPGSKHQYQHYPSALGSGRSAHDNIRVIFYPSMTNFMRYLGYQWLGTMADGNDAMPDNGPAILGGVAEDARQGILSLTPEMALAHSMWSAITDLPVAPTNPIDAGMFRFCASCGKCADICPSSSINKDKEPSWDLPLVQGKPSIEHHLGRKAFWSDGAGCRLYINENSKCHMCIGSCSFMVGEGAMVHSVLKPTIASTGLLDGFFTKMSTTFGYGLKPPEEWWDENLPIMGFDSTCVSGAGYHQ